MAIPYPVSDILTPQTLVKYQIRTMTFGDELKLRTSILAGKNAVIQNFNKFLFDLLSDKPEEVKTYDDFLTKTTIADREAIVLGLYHITYGDEFVVTTSCPFCGQENTSKVSMKEHVIDMAFKGKPYEILDKKIAITLPITQYNVQISVPNLKKELEYMKFVDIDDRLFEILSVIDFIEIDGKKLSKSTDLMGLVKLLPAKDAKLIKDRYTETLSIYNTTIKYKIDCKACQRQYDSQMDFLQQLFRVVI